MGEEHAPSLIDQQTRQEAEEAIRNRLALISTVIWAVGVVVVSPFILFILGPENFRPVWGMIIGFALLIPAALPWLAYRRLVAASTRERAGAEYRALNHPGNERQTD